MNTPKKPGKLKELEARAVAAEQRAALLEVDNATIAAELAGFRSAQAEHGNELREAQGLLATAKTALAPFRTKTDNWEGVWPVDTVPAIRTITFGDFRRARDAAIALGAK